ncbi:trypsin-like serine protease [Rheinheimera riviphila]|uniref:peptidase Do n=1 Tax=Rheinheimera riviphila TaxID=1834037 RepID=A0A437R524_9GAMM|nr:trypsin-like peptidase domain-containing protein [Rheinheimera riviphila]RVU41878.1 trypsin-like serine protease [Rheinheimera riviphila]
MKSLIFIIRSIAYGLALALLWLLLFQQNGVTQLNQWLQPQNQEQSAISYAKAVRAAAPAVVNVYTVTTQQDPRSYQRRIIQNQSLGSGVIMRADGYILTNYHVVNGADQIVVALQDGRQLEAVLIGQDRLTDLAVLYVKADNLPVIPQLPDIEPQVGDLVLAIGNPLNLGQSITQGIISATGRAGLSTNTYTDFMQMDAAINAGNSGGALVNSNGILVGINTAAFQRQRNLEVQGIFFAVPYKLAFTVMEKLISHGRVVRGYLGLSGEPVINSSGERQFSTAQKFYGMKITDVENLGPAAVSGLLADDIMLEIQGVMLTSVNQALDIVAESVPDTDVQIVIERRGQRMVIPTRIGTRLDTE